MNEEWLLNCLYGEGVSTNGFGIMWGGQVEKLMINGKMVSGYGIAIWRLAGKVFFCLGG